MELAFALAVLVLLTAGVVQLTMTERRRAAAEERRSRWEAQQTELLAGLASATGESLRPALKAALDESLVPAIRAVDATLAELSRETEVRQREALRGMAASFKDQLVSGFQEEFGALARALHEAAEWQERVHRDLGQLMTASTQLSEGHLSMLRRTRQVSEAVRSNGDSLARAERSLALAADRVQGASTSMTGAMEQTTKELTDRLRQASEEMSAQLGQLATTLDAQMEQS
ncbi:MAG TPA: hypothetical protein VFI96_01300, partial [Longimicrobiaceae bacterium]|nr:hypothetical protein [Longimicrobiaceae bacterium]